MDLSSLSRWASLCSSLLLGSIILGCTTGTGYEQRIYITERAVDGTIVQEGSITLKPHEQLEIFYPVPFAQTPKLELDQSSDRVELIAQKDDRFGVRNTDLKESRKITWRAQGLRLPPSPAVPIVVDAPPRQPPGRIDPSLPERPIPIGGS